MHVYEMISLSLLFAMILNLDLQFGISSGPQLWYNILATTLWGLMISLVVGTILQNNKHANHDITM